MKHTPRPLSQIAADIRTHWPKPYFGAVPYIAALGWLQRPDDFCGNDSARTIIAYFLCNASTWKGEDARRIKAELKGLTK